MNTVLYKEARQFVSEKLQKFVDEKCGHYVDDERVWPEAQRLIGEWESGLPEGYFVAEIPEIKERLERDIYYAMYRNILPMPIHTGYFS